MKMLNPVGTPKTKLRAIRTNCWLLIIALLLGIADPLAYSAILPRLAGSAGTLDSPDRLPGEATLRPASDAPAGKPADRALRDFGSWLHYLQRSAGDAPDEALNPTSIRLTSQRGDAAGRTAPHPATAPMAPLIAYRPHAPPRRIFPEFPKHNS